MQAPGGRGFSKTERQRGKRAAVPPTARGSERNTKKNLTGGLNNEKTDSFHALVPGDGVFPVPCIFR